MPEIHPASGLTIDAGQSRGGARLCQAALAVGAVLCLLAVFFLHYGLELAFDHLRALAQYDVLFDADPSLRLRGFAHGWDGFNRSFIHPNLANFVNPPIRFLAQLLHLSGFAAGDPLATRRALALLVTPLASTLQAFALWSLFRRLGHHRAPAFLLALIGAASFSQLIFGSVPDHFALSNLLLTVLFLLAVDLARDRRIRWLPWVLFGWLAAGITITNLLAVGILFAAALRFGTPPHPAVLRHAVFLLGTVALLTGVSYGLLSLGYDRQPPDSGATVAWTGHFWRPDFLDNALRFPTAVADAIVPTEPDTVPIGYLWPRGSHYRIRFTLQNGEPVFTGGNLPGTALVFLLAAGAALQLRRGGWRRAVAVAALALLGLNGLMHAAWGKEYFLYSQHWLTASLLLLAGLGLGEKGRRLPWLVLLGALAAVVLIRNFSHLRFIIATLQTLS